MIHHVHQSQADSKGTGDPSTRFRISNLLCFLSTAPLVRACGVKEGVTPSVVDMTMEKDTLSSLEVTTVLGSFPPLPMQVITLAGNAPGKSSYANVTGKLGKYGRVCSMFISSTELFSFQFISMDGLDDMVEYGPWSIWNNPLILKKWHSDVNLLKEDVSTILVWVKLYGVPVMAFSEDGLSAIATKIGTPLMLDSYTFDMCLQSWGRSSYARAMIELRDDVELKDNIVDVRSS
ncbi:retrotransposon protein, putative, ty3-gypsy subclass [Tanacetum coccineum]